MKTMIIIFLCFFSFLGFGQYLVKDLNTAPKGSNPENFINFYNGYVYFIATTYHEVVAGNFQETKSIWYSYQGGSPQMIGGTDNASDLVNYQGTLYFFLDNASLNKLGTATGQVTFIDWIFPQSGFEYDAHELTVSGSKMYFFSNNSLWVSGGTEANTIEISTTVINPQELTEIHFSSNNNEFLNRIIFSAEDASGDREPYTSTGSSVSRLLNNVNNGLNN